MNVRTIIFSGIMTALIGAMIGLAINHISQRESRRTIAVIGGAVIGFVVGSASDSVRQQRNEEYEELGKQDKWE